jgi:hypothetical protein
VGLLTRLKQTRPTTSTAAARAAASIPTSAEHFLDQSRTLIYGSIDRTSPVEPHRTKNVKAVFPRRTSMLSDLYVLYAMSFREVSGLQICGPPIFRFHTSRPWEILPGRSNATRTRYTVTNQHIFDAERRAFIKYRYLHDLTTGRLPQKRSRRRRTAILKCRSGFHGIFTTESLYGRPFYAVRLSIHGALAEGA